MSVPYVWKLMVSQLVEMRAMTCLYTELKLIQMLHISYTSGLIAYCCTSYLKLLLCLGTRWCRQIRSWGKEVDILNLVARRRWEVILKAPAALPCRGSSPRNPLGGRAHGPRSQCGEEKYICSWRVSNPVIHSEVSDFNDWFNTV